MKLAIALTHIIFTRAPANFTWAQAQVCPDVHVAMPPSRARNKTKSSYIPQNQQNFPEVHYVPINGVPHLIYLILSGQTQLGMKGLVHFYD